MMWGYIAPSGEYRQHMPEYGPPQLYLRTHYCVACDCTQAEYLEGQPCWQCGAPTKAERPASWPTLSGPRMVPPHYDEEGEAA